MNWKLVLGAFLILLVFAVIFTATAIAEGFWFALFCWAVALFICVVAAVGAWLFAIGLEDYNERKRMQ